MTIFYIVYTVQGYDQGVLISLAIFQSDKWYWKQLEMHVCLDQFGILLGFQCFVSVGEGGKYT